MRSANPSITVNRACGCGTIHMALVYNDDKKPLRVHIWLGKAGGCTSAQLQGIEKLMNRLIELGDDLSWAWAKKDNKPTEDSLLGIRCPEVQREFDKEVFKDEDDRIGLSCTDVIAKMLRYLLGKLTEV